MGGAVGASGVYLVESRVIRGPKGVEMGGRVVEDPRFANGGPNCAGVGACGNKNLMTV